MKPVAAEVLAAMVAAAMVLAEIRNNTDEAPALDRTNPLPSDLTGADSGDAPGTDAPDDTQPLHHGRFADRRPSQAVNTDCA